MQQKQRQENCVAGAVGAFLGSVIGVVCIVILGQLGYVASISGLIMAVCAMKGYELLGGALSKKGIVISAVLIVVMTYVGHRLDWAISAASFYAVNILEAFRGITYLLDAGAIKASTYWGGLALLYVFTLLGAVPTMLGGLREGGAPAMPQAQTADAAEASGEKPEIAFYPGEKNWMRSLRISACVSIFPGLMLTLVLLMVANRHADAALSSMMGLGSLIAAMIAMFAALPVIQLCNSANNYLYAKQGTTVWRVDINRLNRMDSYRFTRKSGALVPLRWDRLPAEDQQRLKASVVRAITTLCSGAILPGSILSRVVMPLTDLQLIRETRWSWKMRYRISGGGRRTITVAKAYPDFRPLPETSPAQGPVPYRWGLCMAMIVLALLFAALGGALGQL